MNETQKMNKTRKDKGYDLYFSGHGIDIGCGKDILNKEVFTNIKSIQPYDVSEGDANHCDNIKDNQFDFVYSSHCLEHMNDPKITLKNWIRICKPRGYIIVAIPHEVYYEKMIWPSKHNPNHTWSFRLEEETNMPKSIWVQNFLSNFQNTAIIRCDLYLEKFDFTNFWKDQTRGDAICQIEFVLKKVNRNILIF